MIDLSPKQRVFGMLASLARIVNDSADLNAERNRLAHLIEQSRSWETQVVDVQEPSTEAALHATRGISLFPGESFTFASGTTVKARPVPDGPVRACMAIYLEHTPGVVPRHTLEVSHEPAPAAQQQEPRHA